MGRLSDRRQAISERVEPPSGNDAHYRGRCDTATVVHLLAELTQSGCSDEAPSIAPLNGVADERQPNANIDRKLVEKIHAHWADRKNYDRDWDQRAAMAASGLSKPCWVSDIGCGPHQSLKNYLPHGSRYLPADMQRWNTNVVHCDLNAGDVPVLRLLSSDVVFILGVLEYLTDVPSSLRHVSKWCDRVIFSYVAAEHEWQFDLWINRYSRRQIMELWNAAGFDVTESRIIAPGSYVFTATRRKRVSPSLRRAARLAILLTQVVLVGGLNAVSSHD